MDKNSHTKSKDKLEHLYDKYNHRRFVHPDPLEFLYNYKDIKDLIRMIKMRIRIPDQWYGDYLALVGACRIGEKRLKELCARYGKEYVKAFIRAYMDYGEVCIKTEIKKLTKKPLHLEYETCHDPIPGIAETDKGIPVRIQQQAKEGS